MATLPAAMYDFIDGMQVHDFHLDPFKANLDYIDGILDTLETSASSQDAAITDINAKLGGVSSGNPVHTRLNSLEALTTNTSGTVGHGNVRLSDRIGAGVTTASTAAAQLTALAGRATTLESAVGIPWTGGTALSRIVTLEGASAAVPDTTCIVLKTTTQAVVTGGDAIVTWSSAEQNDTYSGSAAMWSSGNSTQIICQRAGVYAVGAKLSWANNTTGANRVLYVTKNSTGPTATASVAYATASPAVAPGGGVAMTANGEARLAVGDILRCVVFQDSGGNLNIDTTSFSGYGRFWASWIRS